MTQPPKFGSSIYCLMISRWFLLLWSKITGTTAVAPFLNILLTDTQLGDQSTVTVDVLVCQIVQHLAALTNHHQQTTTGVVVVLVYTQVNSQLVDASGQNSNLNLGGTGIAFVSSVLQDTLGLLFLQNHGKIHLSKIFPGS